MSEEQQQPKERQRKERAPCRWCGKSCAVRTDGTARRHTRTLDNGMVVDCQGSGQPVVSP